MKIKIIKCSGAGYWYKHRIGEVFDVEYQNYKDYTVTDPADGNKGGIDKSDAEIVQEPLTKLDITLADMSTEALQGYVEAIQAHIAERIDAINQPKPFGQEDYERVVAELRACEGRKKFVEDQDNYCIEIWNKKAEAESYKTMPSGVFQVYFKTLTQAREALSKVGKENILKAVEWESGIGL